MARTCDLAQAMSLANLDRQYKAYQDEQAYPVTMQQLLTRAWGCCLILG